MSTKKAIAKKPAAPVVATPMDLLAAAVAQDIDENKLEKLMELQERWEANLARKAFTAAMADFQANCPTIRKSGAADRYLYAPLDEVLRTIRPHLDAAGLSVRFNTETQDGAIKAICTVSHRDGHEEISEFIAPVDPNMKVNASQRVGSANSYAKRYSLMNALNLVASEYDDDARLAGTITITDEQAATIRDHIEALEINEARFLQYLKCLTVDDIPADKYDRAMKAIDRKRSQKELEEKTGEPF